MKQERKCQSFFSNVQKTIQAHRVYLKEQKTQQILRNYRISYLTIPMCFFILGVYRSFSMGLHEISNKQLEQNCTKLITVDLVEQPTLLLPQCRLVSVLQSVGSFYLLDISTIFRKGIVNFLSSRWQILFFKRGKFKSNDGEEPWSLNQSNL